MLHFPKWKIFTVIAVIVLSIYFSLPNFFHKPVLGFDKKINLGLDLQGGSQLLLEVDFDTYLNEQMQNLSDDLRFALRKNKIGYLGLKPTKNSVDFTLRSEEDFDKVKTVVRDISRDLDLTRQGEIIRATYSDNAIEQMRKNVIDQSLEIIRRRVDETGTKEPSIQAQGKTRIILQVPGMDNPEGLKNILGKTAKLTFHLMDESNPFPQSIVPTTNDNEILMGEAAGGQGSAYYNIDKKSILTGDMLVSAQASLEGSTPVVHFRFNNLGSRKFAEATTANVGKPFAIVLDNKVISAPVIREPIVGGSGMISGHFTTQSASDLALLLRAGALPAPLKILEEKTVGPSLGADSIEAGKKAAIYGTLFVIILMTFFYGLFGIFANIALIVNIIITIAALSLFQATLTLPGIAGIVLTIGMAVDANVLIFERMRDEVRNGRSVLGAVDHGFNLAFNTIFDSNVTTLIIAVVLFVMGSGTIKGFAVTLTIGIIASMFTAILLTRLFIVIWLRVFKPTRLPI